MNAQWKPISEVDPAFIDKELKQLERFDVPLLHLEAILVYTPEKFGKAPIQNTLQRLANAGVLTARTLTRWLELSLTDTARKTLEVQLKALQTRRSAARPPTGRICCPVIIGYQCPLLPGVTLGGVRWIEVVSRGPDAGVASGFSDEWPERLEELGKRVQDIIRVSSELAQQSEEANSGSPGIGASSTIRLPLPAP